MKLPVYLTPEAGGFIDRADGLPDRSTAALEQPAPRFRHVHAPGRAHQEGDTDAIL